MKFERIYIEITNICNFTCPFCSKNDRPKKEMTLDEFSFVLSQIKDYTGEICLHVLGEPLLHAQFDNIIQLCKSNNLKINLVTNGYFLKEKQAVIFANRQLFRKINVSLHSYKYVANPHEKIEEILRVCSALSDNAVQVELRNLYDLSDNAFFDMLKNAFFNVFNVSLSVDANQKIKGYLYYVLKKPFVWPDQSTDTPLNVDKSKGIYCHGARSHIAILSNLDVVPCCLDSSGQLLLGSLRQSNLSDILSTPRYQDMFNAFGAHFANETFCKTCLYNR